MATYLQREGIVLRAAAFGESSRMITWLTPQGLMSASAKGVMRGKSPHKAAVELFVRGEYGFSGSHGRYTMTSAQILDAHMALRGDLELLNCAVYFRDFCQTVALEGEAQPALYALLRDALAALCIPAVDFRAVKTYFELNAMACIGFGAQLDACVACGGALGEGFGFSDAAGGVLCADCRGAYEDARNMMPGTLAYLKRVQGWDAAALHVLKSQAAIQREVEEIWESFIRYHLERAFSCAPYLERLDGFSID